MFYMQELPSRDLIEAVGRIFPELDPTAVEACYFLLRTGTDVLTAFDENLSRHGISQSRFIVLLLLKRLELRDLADEEMSPSKLAEQAGVSRGTMTGLLSGLERDGLIGAWPCRRSTDAAQRDRAARVAACAGNGERRRCCCDVLK